MTNKNYKSISSERDRDNIALLKLKIIIRF
jgi:hypothetical protein